MITDAGIESAANEVIQIPGMTVINESTVGSMTEAQKKQQVEYVLKFLAALSSAEGSARKVGLVQSLLGQVVWRMGAELDSRVASELDADASLDRLIAGDVEF